MKDTNTRNELRRAYYEAVELSSRLIKISFQQTHPTIQIEREEMGYQANEYAHSIYSAIEELNDGHTTDANEMMRHLMHIAECYERRGMQERTDLQYAIDLEHQRELHREASTSMTKALAWRYAAVLLAEENGIDITECGAE